MTVVRPISWLPNAKVGEEYVVIVTHSGSRNVGKATEEYYDALAVTETQAKYSKVPKGYAWLDMDGAAGQEYVQAMLLMGQYAQANHHIIHDTFLAKSRLKSLAQVENQHNFAEILEDGTIIHARGRLPRGSASSGSYLGRAWEPRSSWKGWAIPTRSTRRRTAQGGQSRGRRRKTTSAIWAAMCSSER